MKNIDEIVSQLGLDTNIKLEDIPNIDLYMDQVIQLFENKFKDYKRDEDEKVLTKTMINNYAKGKLLFPIKNKKYSKEHLILISLIYQLKSALSINDTKKTLHEINETMINGEGSLDPLYSSYLQLVSNNAIKFKEDINDHVLGVKEETKGMADDSVVHLEKVLLIASLVNMSNFYRRTAEKLVDELDEVLSETKTKDK